MSRSLLLALFLAAGFTAGILWLFNLQFAAGEAYPEYSSLRTDAAGTKVLYDSLASLGSLQVARNFRPFPLLGTGQATILVLGLSREILHAQAVELEELAARGYRVVAAFQFDPENRRPPSKDGGARWKLGTGRDLVELPFGKGTLVIAPDALPFSNGALAFAPDPRLITRALGSNKLVLFDESHLGLSESGTIVGLARRYRLQGLAFGLAVCVALFLWRSMSPFPPLSTEREGSVQSDHGGSRFRPRQPELLTSSQEPRLSTERNVTVQSDHGGYGFRPRRPRQPRLLIAGRTSASGLTALLARNIAPHDLVSTAWSLWTKGNPAQVSPARRRQAEDLLRSSADPLATLARIHSVLKDKPAK
jgi:hypothetical protein